jgi:hypothetical protein
MNAKDAYAMMPELIVEVLADLRTSNCSSIRNFCIISDETSDPGLGFAYCEDEHRHLHQKMTCLVKAGLVLHLEGAIYQLSDEFARQLLDGWPKQRWPLWLHETTAPPSESN